MSVAYGAVGWNRQKRIYDIVLAAGVLLYLACFVAAGVLLHPDVTAETLLIRGLGSAAFVLLHVVLSIGPLCRIDRRFLPLLYNRRHLGVTLFLLGLAHALFTLIQFHALGDTHPLLSVLTANPRWSSLREFPFELLGLAALAILFLMAATSHDFWLANLTPPVWKALHLGVYAAYGLLVMHVALGTLQLESSPILRVLLGAGLLWVLGLHLAAAVRERGGDEIPAASHAPDGWIDAGSLDEIPDGRAKVICASGERVAVFRNGAALCAVSNVCRHQGGPLGEGRILDGCITCPWHGYQYVPETGESPPPFRERVPTFAVRLIGSRVWIDPRPYPPGTRVAPALIPEGLMQRPLPVAGGDEFYVGYLRTSPGALGRRTRLVALALFLGAVGAATLLAAFQREYGPGIFEYGIVRDFEGRLELSPYPVLLVPRARAGRAGERVSRYLIVAPGKFGAQELLAPFDGRPVRLRGSIVYREGRTLIEFVPGSTLPAEASAASAPEPEAPVPLGPVTLSGEIVDSKCFLGVMNPGRAKPHRACAVRCLSGGIPALFVAHDAGGKAVQMLLIGSDGRALNREILDVVAEEVTITGELSRSGELLVLRAEPRNIKRGPGDRLPPS